MKVAVLPVTSFIVTNCYAVWDEESLRGVVIDPGAEGSRIASFLESRGIKAEKILLTHSHADHILGLRELVSATGAEVLIERSGVPRLADPYLNLSRFSGGEFAFSGAGALDDGGTVSLPGIPGFSFRLIHTPGHTPDSSLFYCETEGTAFCGDTVFRGSVGATHFPGGDEAALRKSLGRVTALPETTVLFPGHGEATTVGDEKAFLSKFSAGLFA